MKTIGVLGGLGPQATLDFEARVHAASQRLIAGHGNGGYPPMVGYSEFPLLLGPTAGAPDLVDPAPLLADAAMRRAIE
jgi:hypothetical protein